MGRNSLGFQSLLSRLQADGETIANSCRSKSSFRDHTGSVPVQPLLLASQKEYGMFEHFRRFPWVFEPYLYEDQDRLMAALTDKVIGPAEKKAKEQTKR
jgi:hypothetical protein